MRVLGVDPGASGALAIVRGGRVEESSALRVLRLPYAMNIPDERQLIPIIRGVDLCAIEAVLPSSLGTGLISFKKLATVAASIIVIARTLERPVVQVPARAWKTRFDLLGKPKEAAIEAARAACSWAPRCSSKEQAIAQAEAALIALTGLAIFTQSRID